MNDDVVMHPTWMVDLAEYILLDYFYLWLRLYLVA